MKKYSIYIILLIFPVCLFAQQQINLDLGIYSSNTSNSIYDINLYENADVNIRFVLNHDCNIEFMMDYFACYEGANSDYSHGPDGTTAQLINERTNEIIPVTVLTDNQSILVLRGRLSAGYYLFSVKCKIGTCSTYVDFYTSIQTSNMDFSTEIKDGPSGGGNIDYGEDPSEVNNNYFSGIYNRDYADLATPNLSNRNYIYKRTYRSENKNSYLDMAQYYDGLGRPDQTLQSKITPGMKDLISLQEYDVFGREDKSWLPAAIDDNNGAYVNPATLMNSSKQVNTDQNPYSMPVYENSPLNRILEQHGPGKNWNNKAVHSAYMTNDTNADTLNCKYYRIDETATDTILKLTYVKNHDTGQLYVTRMEDEEGNASFEFKDKLGQVVLTRQIVYNGASKNLHDTYYIYDDFGNLRAVLPPLTSQAIKGFALNENRVSNTSPTMMNFCYLYKYDSRNRCIAKKLPGCSWIYYVYDKADQLILSQDGEQRQSKTWLFTKYDMLGRVILTGEKVLNKTHQELQTIIKTKLIQEKFDLNNQWSYTWTSMQGLIDFDGNTKVLNVNYYDNYKFRKRSDFGQTQYAYTETSQEYNTRYGIDESKYKHKGLLTGSITAILDGNEEDIFSYSVMYYDNRGRLIQTKSNNHLGGVEEEYIAYNFTGQPVEKKHVHTGTNNNPNTTQTEVYTYQYDHAGRLYNTKHSLNGNPSVYLLQNRYDELGRLAKQGIGQQAAIPQSQPMVMAMAAMSGQESEAAGEESPVDGDAEPVDVEEPVGWDKNTEYIGSLSVGNSLSHNSFVYANRNYTPDYQFTLQQGAWVTIEYPYSPAVGQTIITFFSLLNGVYHDMGTTDEEDLSTSTTRKIKFLLGAGTHNFNIYNPLVYDPQGIKSVYTTLTLTAGEGTPGGSTGVEEPEPYHPADFTVSPLQVVEYDYNVRSWTTGIQNDLYSQQLQYGYTGNISRMDWQQQGQNNAYNFAYDELSRLTSATYTGTGQYGTAYSYDRHGNIMSLTRSGKVQASNPYGVIDKLTMTYNGNQLTRVTDNATATPVADSEDFKDYSNRNGQYTYNRNGAMNKDTHKGILGITYNSLNLPTELAVKNINTSGKTYYTYSASGVKLKVIHKSSDNLNYVPVMGTSGDSNFNRTETTDYVGNKVYKNGSLKILVDGGYIENNIYHYYLKDHLGNNRIVVDQYNNQIQSSQYYPFGMTMAESTGQDKQQYKYNGKELDKTHGLNLYDYSARYYEPGIGRFTTVDPLAEKYYSISPYAYCGNNPIKFVDPDGRFFGWPVNPADYQRMATSKQVEKTIKENSSTIQKNAVVGLVAMSDVNDATVLTTAVTRGGNAVNVDGTSASKVDIGFAGLGAIIPIASGSFLKDVAKSVGKAIGKALGIGSDIGKTGIKLTEKQLKSISSLEKQIEIHEIKLEEYVKDPMKFDNKDILKNAPTEEIKEKIIQGRVNHLEHEIKVFKDNIEKIKNGE